ncbi:MAG: DnaA/Hda family protein [Pseudomonadota bacterium]
MTAQQIPLSFEHRHALDAEDFVVADANRDAVAWLDRWPDWPGRSLALYGPAASGKSHLAHVWRLRSGAQVIAAHDLTVANVIDALGSDHRLVVEDADRGVDEEALFHIINLIREEEGFLMLTGREAPARWSVDLPDLASRLGAIPAVAVTAPDDDLLAAVLAKLFDDRQLKVADDVVDYIVMRMERSFSAVGSLVESLDSLSLAERRNITVPLARRVLEQQESTRRDEAWTSD